MQPSFSSDSTPGDLPGAPPVAVPRDEASRGGKALRLVLVIMFVNLGLSVLTAIMTLILKDSVLDFQLAHAHLPASATPAEIGMLRRTLQTALWSRLGAMVLVAAVYIWRAYALRRGSRGAYLRLYYICIFGLIGIAYLIIAGQYPVWMRVEQGLQAVVLIALIVAVSRPEVRARFAKRPNG